MLVGSRQGCIDLLGRVELIGGDLRLARRIDRFDHHGSADNETAVKVAVFSTQSYDRRFLDEASAREDPDKSFELIYYDTSLSSRTAALAQGCDAVCVFVNDKLDKPVLTALSASGVRAVLLRCAGFNNVDVQAAKTLGMSVARVPSYSPEGVAEHAVALIMTLNRQTHRAYNRVRDGNFMLDGLMGFTLHGKTVGVVGTGR